LTQPGAYPVKNLSRGGISALSAERQDATYNAPDKQPDERPRSGYSPRQKRTDRFNAIPTVQASANDDDRLASLMVAYGKASYLAAFIIDSESKAIKPSLRLLGFADGLWTDRAA